MTNSLGIFTSSWIINHWKAKISLLKQGLFGSDSKRHSARDASYTYNSHLMNLIFSNGILSSIGYRGKWLVEKSWQKFSLNMDTILLTKDERLFFGHARNGCLPVLFTRDSERIRTYRCVMVIESKSSQLLGSLADIAFAVQFPSHSKFTSRDVINK